MDRAHEDLPILYAASAEARRQSGSPSAGPGKGRSAKLQVPLEDIPADDVDKIWKYRLPTGELASPRFRKNILCTLRQIYGAARRHGLAETFDRAALSAFRDELDTRKLTSSSIATAMHHSLSLGRIFGAEDDLLELIKSERNESNRKKKLEPSVRKTAFRANPITPLDYARKAHEVSARAQTCNGNRQTRHRLFMTAGILALLSWIPARVKDILGFNIGKEIIRSGGLWHLDLETSKTKFDLATPNLPKELTPYLDDLILLGADPGFGGEVLDRLYKIRARLGSPLFARIDMSRSYSAVTVFEWLKEVTGHGSHAARKSMADYCAEIGLSIEHGMALLGHRSARITQEHYEVFAEQSRRKQTLESLSELRRDLMEDDGAFRAPSGRLVEVRKINNRLRKEGAL